MPRHDLLIRYRRADQCNASSAVSIPVGVDAADGRGGGGNCGLEGMLVGTCGGRLGGGGLQTPVNAS